MSTGFSFRSILVGDDGAPESERAVSVALSLAASCQAKVVLLGVIEPLSAEQQAEGYGTEDTQNKQAQMKSRVEQAASEARARGLDVVAAVLQGDPEEEIQRYVQQHAVDLLVVGHRDVSSPRRWLEGSTSEDLAHMLKVSILIVHAGTAENISKATQVSHAP
jgi:nucleotide-binding universal stress UspA family protein